MESSLQMSSKIGLTFGRRSQHCSTSDFSWCHFGFGGCSGHSDGFSACRFILKALSSNSSAGKIFRVIRRSWQHFWCSVEARSHPFVITNLSITRFWRLFNLVWQTEVHNCHLYDAIRLLLAKYICRSQVPMHQHRDRKYMLHLMGRWRAFLTDPHICTKDPSQGGNSLIHNPY